MYELVDPCLVLIDGAQDTADKLKLSRVGVNSASENN
jgi:hypothetical protein